MVIVILYYNSVLKEIDNFNQFLYDILGNIRNLKFEVIMLPRNKNVSGSQTTDIS